MSSGLVPIPRRDLTRAGLEYLPPVIIHAGEAAAWRFIEFFTATIRFRESLQEHEYSRNSAKMLEGHAYRPFTSPLIV
jgi:hypothetical protein